MSIVYHREQHSIHRQGAIRLETIATSLARGGRGGSQIGIIVVVLVVPRAEAPGDDAGGGEEEATQASCNGATRSHAIFGECESKCYLS